MISHCIPAAGIAGLIKTSLALHHRVLPPTLCESVNPELGIEATPFYVNTEAGPWIARLGSVRRAGSTRSLRGINVPRDRREAPPEAKRPAGARPGRRSWCSLGGDAGGVSREARRTRCLGRAARDDAPRSHRRRAGSRRSGRAGSARARGQGCEGIAQERRAGAHPYARQAGTALVVAQRRLLRQRARDRQACVPVPGRGLAVHEHAGRPRAVLRRSSAVARLLALALRPCRGDNRTDVAFPTRH